jgi:hypothetical protein
VIELEGATCRVYYSERGHRDELFVGAEDEACLFFLNKIESALPCSAFEPGIRDPEGGVRCRRCGYREASHLA